MFEPKKPKNNMEGDAKMKVLDELRSSMSDMMANKMKDNYGKMQGVQKVSVMAPDKEGLAKGLQKAEQVVDKTPGIIGQDDSEPQEDNSPMGMDEIDEAISILQQLKEEMSSKQGNATSDNKEADPTDEEE